MPATLGSGSQDFQRGGKVTECQEDDRSAEVHGAMLDRQAVQNSIGSLKEPEVAAMLEAGSKERLPGRTSSQDQGELKGIRVPAPTQRGKKDKFKRKNMNKGKNKGKDIQPQGKRKTHKDELGDLDSRILLLSQSKARLQGRTLELQQELELVKAEIGKASVMVDEED